MKKNALVQEAVYLLEELGLEDKSGASKKKVNESRTGSGDAAQKVVAQWLAGLSLGVGKLDISTNKPGSRSNDVTVEYNSNNEKKSVHIEVKSCSGAIPFFANEMKKGSSIAEKILWVPGKILNGISVRRFTPGDPEEDRSIFIGQINIDIQNALKVPTAKWQVISGGTGPQEDNLKNFEWRARAKHDGTLLHPGIKKRNAIIVVAPNCLSDKDPVTGEDKLVPIDELGNRVWFFSEGSSKLRPAFGGPGQQQLGEYTTVTDDELTDVWKTDYGKDNQYFAVVTDDTIFFGYINENKLGIEGLKQAKVSHYPRGTPAGLKLETSTYGGSNPTGMREKILIEMIESSKFSKPLISPTSSFSALHTQVDQNAKKSSGRSKQVKEAIELLGILREEKGQ